MTTFALISEGKTDQVILDGIIQHVCDGISDDKVDVNYLHPLRDKTDSSSQNFAGWELVFEYCEKKFADALITNDFVVVHIDTDMGDHVNFGVPLTKEGVARNYIEIVSETQAKLIQKIGTENYNNYSARIIFAVSVHTIETWILLCLYGIDKPLSSLNRLNIKFAKANIRPLIKEVHRYSQVSKTIKSKLVHEAWKTNSSFSILLDDLKVKYESQVARVEVEVPLQE